MLTLNAMTVTCAVGALALTLGLSPACGAPRDDARFGFLDPLIAEVRADTGAPFGLALAIVEDGKVVHETWSGLADLSSGTPIQRDTRFYIASATKPLYAMALLLEERAGTLHLDTPLTQMFPQLRGAGAEIGTVDARSLLTHQSSLHNPALVWALAYQGVSDAATRQALVSHTVPDPDLAPGSFRYSNLGYNLISLWQESARQTPWWQPVQRRVLQPLGMRHTTPHVPPTHVAAPHSWASMDPHVPLTLRKTNPTLHAAGGLYATAADLGRWLVAMTTPGKPWPRALLQRAHAVQAGVTDPPYEDFIRTGYAWGWYSGPYKDQRLLHHFGGFAGYHAHLSFMPERRLGLVILHNEDLLAPRLSARIADVVYSRLLGERDVAQRVHARFAELGPWAAGGRQAMQRQRAALAARPWILSLPMAAYAGRYTHPQLGSVEVSQPTPATLQVRWGRLGATATPYTQPDQIRIEWVPHSGSVVTFALEDRRVLALEVEGMRFQRAHTRDADPPATLPRRP